MYRLNYRNFGAKEARFVGGRVTVDGVEIKSAWLIRTGRRGVVKSYDVLGDGRPHWSGERRVWPKGTVLDIDRAAWIALRGRVRLYGKHNSLPGR